MPWSSWATSRSRPPGATPTCSAPASCAGGLTAPAAPARAGPDIVRALSLDLFFDFLGVRLNGEKAEGKTIVVNWAFPDTGQRYALTLQNCALTYLADRHARGRRRHRDARPHRRSTASSCASWRCPRRWRRAWSRSTATGMKVAELFGLLDDFTMPSRSSSRCEAR